MGTEVEQLRVQVGQIREVTDRTQYFEKLQFLNDELAKKREEKSRAADEHFAAKVEFAKKEYALSKMVAQENKPGFKKKKFEKVAEQKVEVQLRIMSDPALSNMRDKVNKLETRVKLFDLVIGWLQKEIRIWQSFVDQISSQP